MAIRHGLYLAWELWFRKVEGESDCLEPVQIIYGNTRYFDYFYFKSILQEIDELMLRQWDVKVYHVLQEANSCANFLAKIGSSLVVTLDVMINPPVGLSPLLRGDLRGVLFSRD